MQLEVREFGVSGPGTLERDVRSAVGAAVDRFAGRIRRVRVRAFSASSWQEGCRMRVWCGGGPTIVVEAVAGSRRAAVYAAADLLDGALRRRLSGKRARRMGSTRRDARGARNELDGRRTRS
jgi:hypothetical protein